MRTLDFSKPGASTEFASNGRGVSFKRTIATIRPQDVAALNFSYSQVSGGLIVVRTVNAKNRSVIQTEGLSYLNMALQGSCESHVQINGFVTDIKEGTVQMYATSSGLAIIRNDELVNVSAQKLFVHSSERNHHPMTYIQP